MGWFGKKRSAPDANDLLRQYNDAQAVRLATLREGGSAGDVVPATTSAGGVRGAMAVEDVFTITGRGLVATGRVIEGIVRVGDAVSVVREGEPAMTSEITGIEMFRKRATEASAGDMVGVLLRGTIDVARGDLIRVTASA